jgi:23S rRNA (uracil747-C5)-methyltransferase
MIKSSCEYYQNSECNICDLIELDYKQQVQKKVTHLESTLKVKCDEVIESQQWMARDKVKLQVTGDIDNIKIGFLDPTELLVKHEVLSCPLQNTSINNYLSKIKKLIHTFNITPYNPVTKRGELKGLILFNSPTTGETYLRFVLRSKESIDRLKKLANELTEINCISANIQPIAHAILEGEVEIYLKNNSITHQFNDKKIYLSPNGFVQTNTLVASKLYAKASEWLKEQKIKTMIDLFCGHGLFSFHLENIAQNAKGIEISEQAIEMAKLTAKQYHYKSTFISQNVHTIDSKLVELAPELVVINPPRAGLKKLTELLIKISPTFILYSSCNVYSLNKDMELLKKNYQIKKLALFDMFPNSSHYEILTLLIKKP